MRNLNVKRQSAGNPFISAQKTHFILRSTPEVRGNSLVIALIDLNRYVFAPKIIDGLMETINTKGVPLFKFNTTHLNNLYLDNVSNVFGMMTVAVIVDDILYVKLRDVKDISTSSQKYNIPLSNDINITMRCRYKSNPHPIKINEILGFHLSGAQ